MAVGDDLSLREACQGAGCGGVASREQQSSIGCPPTHRPRSSRANAPRKPRGDNPTRSELRREEEDSCCTSIARIIIAASIRGRHLLISHRSTFGDKWRCLECLLTGLRRACAPVRLLSRLVAPRPLDIPHRPIYSRVGVERHKSKTSWGASGCEVDALRCRAWRRRLPGAARCLPPGWGPSAPSCRNRSCWVAGVRRLAEEGRLRSVDIARPRTLRAP